MQTIQGKEYNYEDILLYNVRKDDIVVMINDEEQLRKYSKSGKIEDASIAMLPYSKEEEQTIISSMKQISSYSISASNDKNVEVLYEDGTIWKFDILNLEIINQNLHSQNELKREKAIGLWTNIPEEEKVNKKKDTKRKLVRGVAGVLAAAAIVGGIYHGGKLVKANKNDKETEDPRQTEEGITAVSKFKQEGTKLYSDITKATGTTAAFYKEVGKQVGVTLDEDLCLNIVELLNGVYPTSMLHMNPANAQAEMIETRQAINMIIAANLFPDTDKENIVDLSSYVKEEKVKVLLNNAQVIARNTIDESIGEPMNGEIFDDSKWSDYGVFSRSYLNAVDYSLNYQLDMMNDTAHLTLPASQRFVIESIFQNANNTIPQHSYVVRESVLQPTKARVYYRWFLDDVTKNTYIPRQGVNGTTEYVLSYVDAQGNCHEEVYTEDVMFAMAGLSTVEEQRYLGIEVNPNLHQIGIQNELDNRVNDAIEEMDAMIITNGKIK